ncbi:MAG: tetratricopeptide repeat protein [Bacteroidales bacterium]|nr:tetratricopeptide repeat protein [Bacteroidales bacterium]
MRLDDDLKYFEEPEFKRLLAEYEAARESGMPLYMDAEELTDIAEYYALVAEDEESCNEVIEFALHLHPDAVDPQIFKARQAMLRGDAKGAKEICDAIEEQNHREVLFLNAELLIRANDCEKAFSLLFQSIDAIDEDRDYFIYDSAYIFIDYKYFDWALVFANELEKMSPEWYKTWQLQADVLLGLGKNLNALKYIERMLDVDPFCTESWNWAAEAHSALEHHEKAMESVEYALAIDADNERALQLKAWMLMQQGNFNEAHQLYERLKVMTPKNEQNWLYDSYCMLDSDRLEEARFDIEEALECSYGLSPEQQAIYEQYAHILSHMGDKVNALMQLDFADAFRENPNEWDERMLRGHVYAQNNDLPGLMELVEKEVSQYEDKRYNIFYQAAVICFEYDYYEEAIKWLETLQTSCSETFLKENGMEVHSYLALAAMRTDQVKKALTNLRKAIHAQEPHLAELFEDDFPGVRVDELYDYYYNKVYGRWPEDDEEGADGA